jgi:RNA polymerase sigma-70 factor (ECF subfamily)
VLGRAFEEYRAKLERMIAFRIDPAFQTRIEPGDVIQESYFEASRRFSEFQSQSTVPLFVWIRQRVLQTLVDMQRAHSREKRSVFLESRMPEANDFQSTSLSLARVLIANVPTPSQIAMRVEEEEQLKLSLDAMHETDREILALRHFEHLSNSETAAVLGISPTAASNRYVRAAARLSEILNRFGAK